MSHFEAISDYSEGLLQVKFELVASHLTGRPCKVIWRDRVYGVAGSTGPDDSGIWGGMARKSADGGAVIHLRRGMGWAESMRVFLHEASHIKTTWSTIPTEGQRYFTRKHKYTTAAEYVQTPDEKTADRLAAIWAKWAREQAGTSLVLYQLDALMRYNVL